MVDYVWHLVITMAVFGYFRTKSPRQEISTKNEPNSLIRHQGAPKRYKKAKKGQEGLKGQIKGQNYNGINFL